MKRHIFLAALLVLLLALLAACASATAPIATVDFRRAGAERRQTLLVFLPGLWDSSSVYAEKGFIDAVRTSGIEADMIGVDAHLSYYMENNLLPRLKADVIDPARRQGYRNIWLVGLSLGGFGVVWYDVEYPGDLTGIVALSPYLREKEIVAEVARAGGVKAWRPAGITELDVQHRIWWGMKSYERRERSKGRVYLGYGRRDKFAPADGLLAALLPSSQVFVIDGGGHDWPTWHILWDEILKSRAFKPGGRKGPLFGH